MPKPLHPYFSLGRNIFISSAIVLILIDNFIGTCVTNSVPDGVVFLSSLAKITLVVLIISGLLVLMGLWESREEVACRLVSSRTIKIKQLDPEDHESFEAWLKLDLAHKHLRKSAQIQKFLAYKNTQKP